MWIHRSHPLGDAGIPGGDSDALYGASVDYGVVDSGTPSSITSGGDSSGLLSLADSALGLLTAFRSPSPPVSGPITRLPLAPASPLSSMSPLLLLGGAAVAVLLLVKRRR